MTRRVRGPVLGTLVCSVLIVSRAYAQEMEPRAYSASPVGLNFLVIGYGWTNGSVVLDPDLPIEDVHASVESPLIGVGHTFNLFGDLALVTATLPYARAHVTGKVFEQGAEVQRSGLGDALLKLSINLRGNPAMSPREFEAAPRRTIVGASVRVIAPVGQYFDTKLINLGTNRWAFKPEMGVSFPKGQWDLDAYVGAWFFTTNRDFFPGSSTRTEDPVLTLQGHASYEFRPRLWLALNGTSYRGGSSRVDEADPSRSLNDSRAGITMSMPVGRYSLKIAYSSGVTPRLGGNFSMLTVAWQASWLSAD